MEQDKEKEAKVERNYGVDPKIAEYFYNTTGGIRTFSSQDPQLEIPRLDPVYNYLASGDEKLAPWYNHIRKRKGPISLMIMPTNSCNLNCDFCSNAKRDKTEFLKLDQIQVVLSSLDVRAVELTGGGDPLCHPLIGEIITEIWGYRGIQVGLITNGLNLTSIEREMNSLHWLRISLNGIIDSKKSVPFEVIPKHLYVGTTYILHSNSPPDYLDQIKAILAANPQLQYCKICGDTRRKEHTDRIESKGEKIYFYDRECRDGNKSPCYLGSIKPVLAPNGKLYACSNLVLRTGAYEAEDAIDFESILEYTPYNCKCESCFLWKRNAIVSKLLIDRSVNFV
jgi:MoaA/NifB/PqqE/SkfB family radical SAM enzyme